MSSLDQLVSMGLLDPDFLKLDSAVTDISTVDDKEIPPSTVVLSDSEPESDMQGMRARRRRRRRYIDMDSDDAGASAAIPDLDEEVDDVFSDFRPVLPQPQHVRQQPARRPPSPSPSMDLTYYQEIGYHWLYSSNSYGWWHFAEGDNDRLEELYQKHKQSSEPVHDLTIHGRRYQFNFTNMTQKSNSTRNILRVASLADIALRGVAGTRLDSSQLTKYDFMTTDL